MPSNTPSPFTINVPSFKLSLLQAKLDLVSLPDEIEEAGWSQGSPRSHIKRLVERWRSGYDWRSEEERLNRMLPQFTLPISVSEGFGTLKIHFVHRESTRRGAIPLLFVHGWPGSFLEVSRLLPLLTEPDSLDDPAFHVVALSLPGYGFSEAPAKKGFTTARYAEVCHKLMLSLGYDQYVTQGGDWGSVITRKIASTYGPRHARAWHTNTPLYDSLICIVPCITSAHSPPEASYQNSLNHL
jgi:pimeloyl-ACP methyl ester carboxylesterase